MEAANTTLSAIGTLISNHRGHTSIFEHPISRRFVNCRDLYGLRMSPEHAADMMYFSMFGRIFGEHATNMNIFGAIPESMKLSEKTIHIWSPKILVRSW